MTAFPADLVNLGAHVAQEVSAQRSMSAFVAYAQEIGCTLGEGVMHDTIEVHTEAQATLLNAKWQELTEAAHGA